MLYDEATVRRTVSPAVRTNGTVNGSAVNLASFNADSAIVAVITGTITDGTHTVAVQDSDDGVSGWANVPAGRLLGTPPVITSADSGTQFEIGVQPVKDYVRVSVTTTGATTGGLIAAVVVAGDPGSSPISHV